MTQLSETLSQLVQTMHTDISGKVDKIKDGYSIYSHDTGNDHTWYLRDDDASTYILHSSTTGDVHTTLINPNGLTQLELGDGSAELTSGNGYILNINSEGVTVNGDRVLTTADWTDIADVATSADGNSLQRYTYALHYTSYVHDDVSDLAALVVTNNDEMQASYAYTYNVIMATQTYSYNALVASYNALYAYIGEILTSLDGCLHVSDAPVYEYDAETATLNITTTSNE